MKPVRATLPELTRLYLRACEILEIFDGEAELNEEKEEGNMPSSDAHLVSGYQEEQTSSINEPDASPGQSPAAL